MLFILPYSLELILMYSYLRVMNSELSATLYTLLNTYYISIVLHNLYRSTPNLSDFQTIVYRNFSTSSSIGATNNCQLR